MSNASLTFLLKKLFSYLRTEEFFQSMAWRSESMWAASAETVHSSIAQVTSMLLSSNIQCRPGLPHVHLITILARYAVDNASCRRRSCRSSRMKIIFQEKSKRHCWHQNFNHNKEVHVGLTAMQLLCVLGYVISLLYHYSHEYSGSYWKFTGWIGQGTSSFVLPRRRMSDLTTKLLCQHFCLKLMSLSSQADPFYSCI